MIRCVIDEFAAPVLPSTPVLIEQNGQRRLYVFPDVEGGQCTGQTKRRNRCHNPTWDQGQVAPYGKTPVGRYTVPHYGPLPASVARVYLEQRCRVHNTPDAVAYCAPEWERFDPQRHGQFLVTPKLSDFAESLLHRHTPPVESFGHALRAEYGRPNRQRLGEILLTEPVEITD